MSLTEYDGASRETREGTPPLNPKYIPYTMKVDGAVTKLLRNLEPWDRVDSFRILVVEADERRADQLLSLFAAAGHSATLVPNPTKRPKPRQFNVLTWLLTSGQSVETWLVLFQSCVTSRLGSAPIRATVLGCSPSLSEAPFLDGLFPHEFNTELLAEAVSERKP